METSSQSDAAAALASINAELANAKECAKQRQDELESAKQTLARQAQQLADMNQRVDAQSRALEAAAVAQVYTVSKFMRRLGLKFVSHHLVPSVLPITEWRCRTVNMYAVTYPHARIWYTIFCELRFVFLPNPLQPPRAPGL